MARRKQLKAKVKAKVKSNRKARNTIIEKGVIVLSSKENK